MYLYGMRLIITEKQLKDLIRLQSENQELTEQGEGGGTPEAGTSSDGEKKTGASKWESGVTRGPANQIAVTKWSDVVGSKITRGKANPLSEQVSLLSPPINPVAINKTFNPATDTPTKEYGTFWGAKFLIPTDGSVKVTTWKDDKLRGLNFVDAYEKDGRVHWPYKYIDSKTKQEKTQDQLAPDEDFLKETFPTGTLKTIYTEKDKKWYTVVLTKTQGGWIANNGYFHNDGKQYEKYDPEKHIHVSFTTSALNWLSENWLLVAEVVASIAVGIATGGASFIVQALAQVGVGLTFAGVGYALSDKEYKDKMGLAIGVAIAFIPFASSFANKRLLGPAYEALTKYSDDFAKATTKEEVEAVFEMVAKNDPAALDVLKAAFKEIPKSEFESIIKTKLVQGFSESVRLGKIDLNQLRGYRLKWWKEALLEGGAAFPVGITTGWAYGSLTEEERDREEIAKFLGIDNLEKSSSAYDPKRKASIDSAIVANRNKRLDLTPKEVKPQDTLSVDNEPVPEWDRIPIKKN